MKKPVPPKQKRNRNCFENPSEAKILNTDERLAALEEHQKKKKKSNTFNEIPKQKKILISLPKSATQELLPSDIESANSEESIRGFSCSLTFIIENLDNLHSQFNINDGKLEIHTLFLPVAEETQNLKPKRKIVN